MTTNSFAALETELNARFPERKDVIRGSLSAMLAGEHVLMLGPPGTAKSALVRAIASAFGGSYFERLMTKFSTPEELFGPFSLKGLENDRFSRVVAGKLPEAEFAFVDEVFKSNSAILNSLLTLMNERLFHNDGAPTKCPLISLFGASNELPEGKELEALFDRFMVRFDVNYILRPSNLKSMLLADEPVSSVRLTVSDLRAEQDRVKQVVVTDATVDALITIAETMRAEGLAVSDRRLKKALRLVQAAAYMDGQTETSVEDLVVLVDCLWREPKDRSKVARIIGRIADPASVQVQEVLDAARETAAKVTAVKATTQDRTSYIKEAAAAMEAIRQQNNQLDGLAKMVGRRSGMLLADATAEIASIYNDLTRVVSGGLGLGARKPLGK